MLQGRGQLVRIFKVPLGTLQPVAAQSFRKQVVFGGAAPPLSKDSPGLLSIPAHSSRMPALCLAQYPMLAS